MRTTLQRLSVCLLVLLATGGCTTYYMVRDPVSGNSYYTQDVDHIKGGAVEFKDDRTGNKVTIQNSEIKEINQDEYNTGRFTAK